jgi:hypothetical protein
MRREESFERCGLGGGTLPSPVGAGATLGVLVAAGALTLTAFGAVVSPVSIAPPGSVVSLVSVALPGSVATARLGAGGSTSGAPVPSRIDTGRGSTMDAGRGSTRTVVFARIGAVGVVVAFPVGIRGMLAWF